MKKTAQKLLVGTVGAAGVLLASSTAANADSTTTHKVKQNETVWALSKKYGVSIQSIEKLNRINSNHLIITGQTLQIPSKDGSQTVNKNDNKSTYTIKSGDTLWRIAQNNHISLDELLSLNNLNASDIIYPGQVIKLTSAAATSTSSTQQQVQDKAAVTTPATDNQRQATSASSSSQAVSTAQSSSAATTATSSSVTTPAATTSSSSSVAQQPAASSSSAVQQSSSQVTTQSSSEVKDNNAQKVQYTAKAGDSLYSIAQSFGVSIDSLRSNNNLGATLLPGQTLTIVNPTKTPSQEESSSSNSVATNNTAATNSVAQSSSQQSVANNSAASSSSVAQTNNTQQATTTNTAATNNNATTVNTSNVTTTTNTGSASASAIISYAQSFIGVPYVWGGSTPSGFDCSGLVQYVYAHYGVNLPRVTTAQENAGTVIPVSAAQPGDLYFWGAKGSSYHVAIATGGGSFIHAPEPGESVKVGSTQYFQPSFAVRVLQ